MSASGKSFTYKSIDYGDADYNVYATVRSLPRLPRPRVYVDPLAQGDGSATQGSTFEDVRIIIDCAIQASSTANVETAVSNTLAQLTATQNGAGDLVLDSHPTQAWTARLVSGWDGELYQDGEKFTLEFICPDPWPHATSETTGSGSISSGGTTTI